jgi:glycosyltransferase involved in cell wall biosynthesis
VLHQPQLYAEATHRNALIEVLGAAGAPITLYGVGWEPVVARFPSFTWGGEGSFEETLGLLRRARLVLNTNNGFVDGGHERVFTAMCGGAAVITDHTPYYAETFRLGAEISAFKWARMADAPGQIKALLADEAALAAQARAGAKRALAEHTWTARAELVAQTIREVQ